MDDVGRDLAREKLKWMFKSASTKRQLIWRALKIGTKPEYVSMRYMVPLESILYAKAKWEAEGWKDIWADPGSTSPSRVPDLQSNRSSGSIDRSLPSSEREDLGASKVLLRG